MNRASACLSLPLQQEGCETGEENHSNRQIKKRRIYIRKQELKDEQPSREGKDGSFHLVKGEC